MNQLAPVVLSEYQSEWPSMYESEKEKIVSALGDSLLEIHHIGSTALPGAVAKPEIDIMILVKSFGDSAWLISALEPLGYVYFKRFEDVAPERRYFRKSDGIVPLYHLHILESKDTFWNDRIVLKDYLLKHPEMIEHYNESKKRIAELYSEDRKQYSAEKDKVVDEMLERAREEKLK